LAIFKKGIET
jgi:ATP-binding cassette subfamily C (CFTR/MRP) protein 1